MSYLFHFVELLLGHVPLGVAQLAQFLPRRVKVWPRRSWRYHVARVLGTLDERVVQPVISIFSWTYLPSGHSNDFRRVSVMTFCLKRGYVSETSDDHEGY